MLPPLQVQIQIGAVLQVVADHLVHIRQFETGYFQTMSSAVLPRLNAQITRSSVTRVPPARYTPWASCAKGMESTRAAILRLYRNQPLIYVLAARG